MAITKVGTRYRGEKIDRDNDSLGSSADGTNSGITLFNGKEITWTSSGSTTTYNSVTKSASSAGWTNNYAHSQSYSSGIVIVEFDPNVGQGYGSLCGFDDGTNNSTPTDITLGMAGLTSASNCNTIVSGTSTDHGSNSWASGDIMKVEYNIGTGAYSFYRNGGTAFRTGTISSPPSSVRILVSSYSQNYKVTEIKLSGSGTSATANLQKLGTGAYSFDGSNDKVLLGSASDWKFLSDATANTWSIAWWMKYNDTLENGHTIMSTTDGSTQNDGFFIDNSGSGNLRLIQVDGDDGTWSSAIPDNTSWHHYAITWNAGTVTLYVDGVSKGTQSQTAGSGTPQYPLTLGANNDEYFTALTLDDIGIYKRVLTATEISTLCGSTGSLDSDDFDNVYGSTQYARGFKVATSSSALKDKKVKAVTFYVRKAGSPTGTAYAKIYNGTTVVETNTTGTNLDVSTLGTSDYTAHKFEFTGNTTLDTGYSVVYYFDGGSGSAYTQIRRQGSDVYDGVNTIYRKYHSSAWADDSGTDAKFILEFADPQLVSSLTNKSELKANYTMDSTVIDTITGVTPKPTFGNITAQGNWEKSGSGGALTFTNGINQESGGSGNMQMPYLDLQNSSYLGSGNYASETKWTLRWKQTWSNAPNNYGTPFMVLSSTTGVQSASQNYIGIRFDGGGITGGGEVGSAVDGASSSTSVSTSYTSTTYYMEMVRDGSNMYVRNYTSSAYDTIAQESSAISIGSGTYNLRYIKMIPRWDTGSGDYDTIWDEVKFYDGVNSVDGCKNDASATSDLDALSGVKSGSVFLQTNDTPKYYWYDGTSWKIDGTTAFVPSGSGLHVGGSGSSTSTFTATDYVWASSSVSTIGESRQYSAGAGNKNSFWIAGGSNAHTSRIFDGSSWSSTTALDTERRDTTAGGGSTSNAIIACGRNQSGTEISTSSKYNGTAWSSAGTVTGGAGEHVGGAGTGSSFLATGGSTRNDKCDKYDGTSWSASAVLPQTTVRSHNQAGRSSASAHTAGGNYASSFTWDGTSWATSTNYTQGGDPTVRYPTGGGTADHHWIMGGLDETGGSSTLSNTELWNGSTWTAKDALPTANYAGLGDGSDF